MENSGRPITGSIQPKDGKWYAIINFYVEGKRKPKWFNTGYLVRGDKRKATEFLQAKLTELNHKRIRSIDDADSSIQFMDFLYTWLEVKKTTLSPNTYDGYRTMVSNRIHHYFAPQNLTLRELRADHFEKYYMELLKSGLTSCTVLHHHRLLKQAVVYAARTGILTSNIMERVKAPADSQFIAKYYSKEEALDLIQKAKGNEIYIPVLLAVMYGLRRSEVVGLKWSSIDFEKQTISIESKVIIHREDGKNIYTDMNKLKSDSSRRTLPLIPFVADALKQAKRQDTKNFWDRPDGYVCLNAKGKLLTPDSLSKKFSRLLEEAGLRKIRYHDLRHTCASLLAMNDISMQKIQIWLGHSDYRTTVRYYAHLDSKSHLESAAMINSLLVPQSSKSV